MLYGLCSRGWVKRRWMSLRPGPTTAPSLFGSKPPTKNRSRRWVPLRLQRCCQEGFPSSMLDSEYAISATSEKRGKDRLPRDPHDHDCKGASVLLGKRRKAEANPARIEPSNGIIPRRNGADEGLSVETRIQSHWILGVDFNRRRLVCCSTSPPLLGGISQAQQLSLTFQ